MKTKDILTLAFTIFLSGIISFGAHAAEEEGNGKVIKKERTNLSPFTTVEAGGIFDIVLMQGTTHVIIVETDENLQERINTTIKDGTLTLSATGVEKASKLTIYITAPNYKALTLSGACNIVTDGIIEVTNLYINFSGAVEADLELKVTEALTADIGGAAEVDLQGKAEDFIVIATGAAEINAKELIASNANIQASGVANVKAYATDKGEAVISGAADVDFVESQTAIYNITKSGQATKSAKEEKETKIFEFGEEDESVNINVGDIEVDVKDGESTRVRVGGQEVTVDEDGNVDIKKVKKTKFDGHWGGLQIGINGYLNSANELALPAGSEYLEPKYQRSYQFNLNLWEQNINLINNHLGLITGVGFQWNNYFYDNNVFLHNDSSMLYGTYGDNENRTYEKSKLVVSYLSIPLMLEYQTNKYSRLDSFHATAGMIMGIRLNSHSKNIYNDNGKNKVKGWEDYHLAPFRWDAHAGLGWGKINLFANYSLGTLFMKDQGPELYPFTIGITLLGW